MAGPVGRRSRLVTGWVFVVLLAASGLPNPASALSPRDGGPVAFVGGSQIALSDVASLHCHDRDYPIIRCFLTPEERAIEEAQVTMAAPSEAFLPGGAMLLNPFVRWYRDPNSGGPSYTAYISQPDLASVGWDNLISSFTPLYGGHPVWWSGANQTGTRWDWGLPRPATSARPTTSSRALPNPESS